mmetsp:Transcript_21310/g.54407  ORF Transcript_21310/g.54407 Transcript_21310/m.54407 type:complete len:228 (+) Transcript_21310:56-739(+)
MGGSRRDGKGKGSGRGDGMMGFPQHDMGVSFPFFPQAMGGVPAGYPPPFDFQRPPSGWQQLHAVDGTPYYYNAAENRTTWDRPVEISKGSDPMFVPNDVHRGGVASGDNGWVVPTASHNQAAPFRGGRKEAEKRRYGPAGCNLFIFHLPDGWTDADVRKHFSAHGKLVSVRVMTDPGTERSRGFGFVSYETREAAAQACQKMNGFKVGGKRLKVELKKGDDEDESNT